jgi:hypothetical protein
MRYMPSHFGIIENLHRILCSFCSDGPSRRSSKSVGYFLNIPGSQRCFRANCPAYVTLLSPGYESGGLMI